MASASVIITTYKSDQALRHVLLGYRQQDASDFEVIVAEDGCHEGTRAVIEEMRHLLVQPIVHVTQPDRGFRKTRILNQAIRSARSDYLIFSDGDCIPRYDFVRQHLAAARQGRFVSGGTIRLPRDITARVSPQNIASGDVVSPKWLESQGMNLAQKWPWLHQRCWLSKIADMTTTTRPTFNGHNSSAWKQDVLAVNGFDERMRYGGLDRELGERLTNAGISGIQMRHRAICVHLDHERGYVSADAIRRNRQIRAKTRANKSAWTPYGIVRRSHSSGPRLIRNHSEVARETGLLTYVRISLKEFFATPQHRTPDLRQSQRIANQAKQLSKVLNVQEPGDNSRVFPSDFAASGKGKVDS